MRILTALAALSAAALPLAAQKPNTPPAPAHAMEDHDKPVTGGGTLPAGWTARTDNPSAMNRSAIRSWLKLAS